MKRKKKFEEGPSADAKFDKNTDFRVCTFYYRYTSSRNLEKEVSIRGCSLKILIFDEFKKLRRNYYYRKCKFVIN